MSLRKNSVWAALLVGVVAGVCISSLWSDPRPVYAAERLSLASLDARLFALETLLADVTLDPNGDLVIEGINLHIRNGTGATDGEVNGRGNLIVGYDEAYDFGSDKSGSHNIVVGPNHSYTSYGGFVAGSTNEILAPYSSVSGGEFNTASELWSSVSGGRGNTASGRSSSVSGGNFNTASGFGSSISGGFENTATADRSSVGGGLFNTATGLYSSVSGGFEREAIGHSNWRAGSLLESQ